MGRHSTIVLVNQSSGKILDAIKHIGMSQNSYRSLLPGAAYVEPPKQYGRIRSRPQKKKSLRFFLQLLN